MPYRGGSLVDLFKRRTTGPPTSRLLVNVADAGGALMTDLAAAHTPVDTGELRERWEQLPIELVEHNGERAYQSGASNPTWYAHLVEYGVEPHEIEEGVKHPGFEGRHMTSRAAAGVEVLIGEVAEPHVVAWALEIEIAAKRHKGIH